MASPAKLRLMLLERSAELARAVAESWRTSPAQAGPSEQSLTLLDCLNELLAGITSDESEVCHQVADLYVFLTKHLLAAEEKGDPQAIDEIEIVLLTEVETWRLVVAAESNKTEDKPIANQRTDSGENSGGLNLQA